MDASAIQSLVSSLGFPIVVCGAMFWFINKTMKEFTNQIRDSINILSDAISQNTTATQKLVTTVELISRIEEKEESTNG